MPNRSTRLSRPLIGWRVPAGFPSPAQDYAEGRIDLNRDLVKHPLATFYIRVEGDSMEPRVHEGALLIVDRMVEAREGSVVIARIGSEFVVKRLHVEQDGQSWLLSENETYPPIQITEGMDFRGVGPRDEHD